VDLRKYNVTQAVAMFDRLVKFDITTFYEAEDEDISSYANDVFLSFDGYFDAAERSMQIMTEDEIKKSKEACVKAQEAMRRAYVNRINRKHISAKKCDAEALRQWAISINP
jgi:hypothetical protein